MDICIIMDGSFVVLLASCCLCITKLYTWITGQKRKTEKHLDHTGLQRIIHLDHTGLQRIVHLDQTLSGLQKINH